MEEELMRISRIEHLLSRGDFAQSNAWKDIRNTALHAIAAVDWPLNSGAFTIYPESGRKRGQGNGVKPIKNIAIDYLLKHGWQSEYPWPAGERIRPGNMDAAYLSSEGLVAFEWETGNISSSHRSINKICLGLVTKKMIAGMLVVPSRELYRYLTDRIGNIAELEPYFPLWRAISCDKAVLDIIVIEHDAISYHVPRIPKGTDGRSAS